MAPGSQVIWRCSEPSVSAECLLVGRRSESAVAAVSTSVDRRSESDVVAGVSSNGSRSEPAMAAGAGGLSIGLRSKSCVAAVGPPIGLRSKSSVTAVACQWSYLEFIPNELFLNIFKWLDLRTKKSLRLVSWRLFRRSQEHEKTCFKNWSFKILTLKQLWTLSKQVQIIKGLECRLSDGPKPCALDAWMAELKNTHPEMTSLKLHHAALSGKGLKVLLSFQDICRIDLSHSEICLTEGQLISDFEIPNSLQHISLAGVRTLTHRSLVQLLRLTGRNLRSLNLSGTNIKSLNLPGSVFRLSRASRITLPLLERLDLSDCTEISEAGLSHLLGRVGPGLQELNLAGLQHQELVSTSGTAFNFPSLIRLDLSRCEFDAQAIRNLTQAGVEGLINLNLQKSSMTDEGLLEVLDRSAESLVDLKLDYCSTTLGSLGSLESNLNNLRVLSLSSSKVTNSGLLVTLDRVRNTLVELDLSYTDVDLENIYTLQGNLRCLVKLNLEGCSEITESGFYCILNKLTDRLLNLNVTETRLTVAKLFDWGGAANCLENISLQDCLSFTTHKLMNPQTCMDVKVFGRKLHPKY